MWEAVTVGVCGEVAGAAVVDTARARAVGGLFGIPLGRGEVRRLFAPFEVRVCPGTVMLITGPSGAGKSTLLRGIEAGLRGKVAVVRLEEIALPGDVPVVDCFAGPLEEGLRFLALAGLSEAHLLLRSPAELSEGQRFRYRLAQFFASGHEVLLADEFAATLDRITARVVAHQVQKFVHMSAGSKHPKTVVAAATHEDVRADLAPDVWIYKGLGESVKVTAI